MTQASAMAQHELNKQGMKEIDGALDVLVDVTGKTATNARAIGGELTEQIEIMKDTNEHMDRTDANINKATDGLKKVEKTGGGTFCSWIVMVLLVIGVVVLIFVPIPKLKK
jgi:hypothetical protein